MKMRQNASVRFFQKRKISKTENGGKNVKRATNRNTG